MPRADKLDYFCVDIVGDISEVLAKIPENSIMSIRSFHALEHLEKLDEIMRQLEAILKDD